MQATFLNHLGIKILGFALSQVSNTDIWELTKVHRTDTVALCVPKHT